MKNKLLQRDSGRTYSILMESGDDVVRCLTDFARLVRLSRAQFRGTGGLREVVLGCFEVDGTPRVNVPIPEPVGVASLVGDIELANGEPRVEPRAVLTRADGSAWGGRLLAGQACPRLEILLSASD